MYEVSNLKYINTLLEKEKQIKSLEDSIEFKEFSLKEDKYKLQLLQRDLQEKS